MTDLRTMTLKRLESSSDLPGASKAKEWLSTTETWPLSERPVEVRVHDVRNLWRVRLRISNSKGHTLEKAPELLATLERMHPLVKLEQIGFAGPGLMGNIFFAKMSGEFIGRVTFPTPDVGELQRAS